MKIGLQVSDFTWPDAPASIGPTFARIARNADEAGMASLWVMDHFFQIAMVGPPEHEMLEGYTALAYARGHHENITLGTLVTGVTYRHPGLLIKTVTTLDVLSGGRACLGIGAAWNEEEHRGLGVPYPPLAKRFERLEETLQIAHQMWSGDDSAVRGRALPARAAAQLARRPVQPAPADPRRRRREKKTLRLVAQYADACNIFDMGPDAVKAKYDVLRGHCEAVGRDYADIEKTVLSRVDLAHESVEQVVQRFGPLAAIGTQHVIVGLPGVDKRGAFDKMTDLVAQVNALS